MKKFITVMTLGLMTMTTSAFADSYYDRVKGLFDTGTAAASSDVLGLNVGRCFFRDDPYTIRGGVIYGRVDNTGAGPIDESLVVARAGVADDFTYLETAPVNEIVSKMGDLLPVRNGSDVLYIDNKINDPKLVHTFEVKKNNTYLVYRIGTFMYCYTFNKR